MEFLNILKDFNISLDDDPLNLISDVNKLQRYEEILMMYLGDIEPEFSKNLIHEYFQNFPKYGRSRRVFYLLGDIDNAKNCRLIDYFTKKFSNNYSKNVNRYFKLTEKIKIFPNNIVYAGNNITIFTIVII